MYKNLLIEVHSHATDLIIFDTSGEIDFRDYSEQLDSTFSGMSLYLVDDSYYEDRVNSEEHKKLVATIYGRYFDIDYAMNNGISMYEVFGEPDADKASLISYLLDDDGEIKDEYHSIYHNIYYLDRIEVEEKFRGQGYAKFLLKNLPEILMYVAKLSVGLIMIQAQPYDRIDGKEIMDCKDNNRKERLIKLYENSGYTRIGNSNYLYLINE